VEIKRIISTQLAIRRTTALETESDMRVMVKPLSVYSISVSLLVGFKKALALSVA
jgi:hypothetical protein